LPYGARCVRLAGYVGYQTIYSLSSDLQSLGVLHSEVNATPNAPRDTQESQKTCAEKSQKETEREYSYENKGGHLLSIDRTDNT